MGVPGRTSASVLMGIVAASGVMRAAWPEPPPGQSALPVQVAVVRQEAIAPSTWVPGSIVSRHDARIATVVAGRVVDIVDVGKRVAAGARLTKLDDTPFTLRMQDLEAQAARARAQYALATAQLDRFRRLAATHALSVSQLDDSKAQADIANADLLRATAQLKQAAYEQAESELRAPFAGILVERFVQRGEFVQVGAPVVRLVSTTDTEARATAALLFASATHSGQAVTVRGPGVERHGEVKAVIPVGDDRSRQFEVRVAVSGPALVVGTPIEISLPTAPGRTALVVPRDAIVIRQNRSYVLRVNSSGIVDEVATTLGIATADAVEVHADLAVGDRVVVRGAERLSTGHRVVIVTGDRGPTAAARPRQPT